MSKVTIPLRLAPTNLSQPIFSNWDFNFINIDLGTSSNPEIEYQSLSRVGSYGKQIGHIAEALALVIKKLGLLEKDLTLDEQKVIFKLLADVDTVQSIKQEHRKSC